MPYWILGLVLLVSASVFAASRGPSSVRSLPWPVKGMSVRKMLSLSRTEVETMLEAVEQGEEPDPVMGAMCYEMVAGPSVIEYVCPICGERTLYDDWEGVWKVEELFTVRDLFDSLTALTELDLALDESGFCLVCGGPHVEPTPVLVVSLSDAEPCSTAVSAEDLRMLIGFLSGETWYGTSNDGRMPLRPELPRIRRMLGMTEEE